MLKVYDTFDGALVGHGGDEPVGPHSIWIDLHKPTKDEERIVEAVLGVQVPTREEMQEIEASSRLYQEGGAHFMTGVVLYQPSNDGAPGVPIATPVTFILAAGRLVTVRYEEPRAFPLFLARAHKKDTSCATGCAVLIGLLEAIIDREADRVERIQSEVDKLGQGIFATDVARMASSKRFETAIKQIGREGELTQRSRDCLLSLDRLLTYLAHAMGERGDEKALRARVKTASRDVASLADHVGYLSNKIAFLLDATLGMINIEQNTIIKIFSVASVALMPPTLIASIYGMNFKQMPELEWQWGYPAAVGLMVISAVIPFVYFRRKGWF